MLSIFQKNKENLKNFRDEDLIQIHQFLKESLERNYRSYNHLHFKQTNKILQENEIKNIIESLPIFKSILGKTENILKRKAFLIEKQSILSIEDLNMYCEANNIILIDSKFKCEKLYEYLDIKSLTFDELYIKYLSWLSTSKKFGFFKCLKNAYTFRNFKLTSFYFIVNYRNRLLR